MKYLFTIILVLCSLLAYPQNKTIDSLKEILQIQKADTNKVNILNSLGRAFLRIENKESLEYVGQALALSKKINFKMGQGNALHNLGAVYGAEHDLPTAANYYEAAIKIRQESGDKNGLAASYKSLGFVFMDMGNYSRALKMQLACLKTNETIDDKKGIAASYNNIGILYWIQKDYTAALKNLFLSLKMHEEFGDNEGINHPYNNIAGIYYDQGNYPEALKNYAISLKIREQIGDTDLIADSYVAFGNVYHKLNNNTEALNKYLAALKLYTKTGNKSGLASAFCASGEVNRTLKNFTKARDLLNKGLALYKELGDLRGLNFAYEELARIDSATANYKNALTNYKMSVFYRDSMVNQENTKKFVQTQLQYEFDKKQDSVKAVQDMKDALTLAEIKNQKLARNFSLSGALLIVSFGGYSFYRYRRRRKLQSQQEMLTERLRISRELHDDIGSTLGSISIYSEVAKNRSEKNENANEAISKIGVASRELIEKMSDIIWSINPNNESFEQLQNRMQAFAAMMLTPRNIQSDFFVDEQLKNVQLTNEERKNIFLIFKEAVHNIVKYAECSKVEITLTADNDQIIMAIKDNGRGFDPSQVEREIGTGGNGLKNMKARAADINAQFRIHSVLNEGTMIELKLDV